MAADDPRAVRRGGHGSRGELRGLSPQQVIEKVLFQYEIFRHDRFLVQFTVARCPTTRSCDRSSCWEPRSRPRSAKRSRNVRRPRPPADPTGPHLPDAWDATSEQRDPVPHVEFRRASVHAQSSLARDAFPGRGRQRAASNAAPAMSRDRTHGGASPRRRAIRGQEERRVPARDHQEARIDRGRRIEAMPGDPADQRQLPPRKPPERDRRAGMHRRPLARRLELNQQVRSLWPGARVIQEPSQDRRRQGERDIPEGSPRR